MSEHLPIPDFTRKIVSFEDLRERASELPHPIVMTNGVFDILHRGHVTYLAQAAALGKSLVVAVNSDASVRMLGKGDDRPINTEQDRAAVLAALESVSLVTVFTDKVPQLKPCARISMSRAATIGLRICPKRNLSAPGAEKRLPSVLSMSAPPLRFLNVSGSRAGINS